MISFQEFKTLVHGPKAERMKHDRLYRVGREVSVRMSYTLARLFPFIRANHVSVATIVIVLGVLAANALYGSVSASVLILAQLAALQLAALGDRVDGELARYHHHISQRGIYYDRAFHFVYPFGLYLSTGFFFSYLTGYLEVLVFVTLLAVLAAFANMADNLRHSIKYKIELEKNQQHIQDLQVGAHPHSRPALLWRVGGYLVFMMYDWVWLLYVVLVVGALTGGAVWLLVYMTHLAISLLVLAHHILVVYPRRRLFSREDIISPLE